MASGQKLDRAITEHFPNATEAAKRNLERVQASSEKQLAFLSVQLMEIATAKVPSSTRLLRLRFVAGEWSKFFSAKTACGKGCSHCCNIPVSVSRIEARLIAKSTARKLGTPKQTFDMHSSADQTTYIGCPCTFLVNGKCSIYEQRPIACRLLVNMDDVDLLCRLVPDRVVPVPYLNVLKIQGLLAILTKDEQFADLREWFPRAQSRT